MSEVLAQSFTKMVNMIDSETKFLKGISNLRGADKDVQNELLNIENDVNQLEMNLADFETFLDRELKALSDMNELAVQSEFQQADVVAMKKNIPQYLTTQSTQQVGEGRKPSQDNASSSECPNHKKRTGRHELIVDQSQNFTFITTDELEAIPRSTRGRLTLEQVTTSLHTMISLIQEKSKVSFY